MSYESPNHYQKQVTVFMNRLLNNSLKQFVNADSFCTETPPCVAHNESVHFQVCSFLQSEWHTR